VLQREFWVEPKWQKPHFNKTQQAKIWSLDVLGFVGFRFQQGASKKGTNEAKKRRWMRDFFCAWVDRLACSSPHWKFLPSQIICIIILILQTLMTMLLPFEYCKQWNNELGERERERERATVVYWRVWVLGRETTVENGTQIFKGLPFFIEQI